MSLLANDFTMLGMQFERVDGTSITFGDLQGEFFGGPTMQDADNILLWKEDGYHYYYYGDWGAEGEADGWNDLWYNESEEDASAEEIPAGRAMWYLSRQNTSIDITVAGAVKSTPKTTTILANDYTMFANPYPTAMKFKDISVANCAGGPTMQDADNILLWLNDGYHYYYYGDWGAEGEADGWNDLWYNENDVDASEEEIPAGRACWYLRRGAATTMSFTSPIAK